MTFDVSDDPLDFDEAIAWFRERLPFTDEEFELLLEAARAKAFTVAGVADLDVVTHVWEALDAAIANGTDLREFARAVRASLEAAWQGTVENVPWRLETIFRTNLQLAYAAGRYEQATDPIVAESRPYWMFDAILDLRTTPVCRAWDGKILPADDPAWSDHHPPLHFNCRSVITTLTPEQAEEMGLTKRAPSAKAAEGFGALPSAAGDDWAPKATDYPRQLWLEFEKKTR